jgi:hypothetical protein
MLMSAILVTRCACATLDSFCFFVHCVTSRTRYGECAVSIVWRHELGTVSKVIRNIPQRKDIYMSKIWYCGGLLWPYSHKVSWKFIDVFKNLSRRMHVCTHIWTGWGLFQTMFLTCICLTARLFCMTLLTAHSPYRVRDVTQWTKRKLLAVFFQPIQDRGLYRTEEWFYKEPCFP